MTRSPCIFRREKPEPSLAQPSSCFSMIEFFRKKLTSIRSGDAVSKSCRTSGRIATGSVRFHPSSYADPNGRLFMAEGRLFRTIPAAREVFCRALFDRGVVASLVEKKLLVPTHWSACTGENGGALLEHKWMPHVSYPYEWGAEMLRAAALHTLDVLEELSRHDLTLKDAHGWNVLFDGCSPLFVDFGSIIARKPDEPWKAEQEFREYFLHPLAMMGAGHDRIARTLLRDFEQGIPISLCASIAGLGIPSRPEGADVFSWYRALISGYDLRSADTAWSAYYQEAFPSLEPDASWTGKHRSVHDVLRQYQPATVLDIGSNRGWYALLAAAGGARVTAFDNDHVCINRLFVDAVERKLPIQPLVMSFVNPSPRYGLAGGVMEPAEERLRSDLVLGLAMVHHMVFRMHLNFDQIAAGLAAYTKRTLLVEFPPADDFHVRQWMSSRYAWYTEEGFRAALARHFRIIRSMASDPAPRRLLVCER